MSIAVEIPIMTKFADLFAALAAPFEPEEVKVRTQNSRQLHYITARVAMNGLDNVLGPECWWDEFTPSENSVLCRLTIRLPDGSTLTKADAGGYAGMADSGDDDKSGYSDAFKRACVKFGIGRYLYRDGVPTFVTTTPVETPAAVAASPATNGNGKSQVNGKGEHNWSGASDPRNAPAAKAPQAPAAPRTGKAMFAWVKEQEQRYEVSLLKYMNNWAKLQEFPGRMVDWNAGQVELAYAEACRKLNAIQASHADAYEEALSS